MLNIAVLVSGSGTNLQSIINNIESNKIKNAKISLVICSNTKAYAIKRAEKHNIICKIISKKTFETSDDYDFEILKTFKDNKIDLVVMAGFLSILGEQVINSYVNKIINIHPSLIPAFCGKSYYGIKVHEEVIKYGVKYTGATVHFVDKTTDGGAIIMQKCIEVKSEDTAIILQERVKIEAEWKILPITINAIANNLVTVNGRIVTIKENI